ncbi:MAG: PulJ/GspJ family protein [Puniceicoccales bacterium]
MTITTRTNAGFTLAELLISVGIGALVLTGVMSVFMQMTKSGLELSEQYDIESRYLLLLNRFGQDARQCRSFTITSSPYAITFTNGGDISSYAYNRSQGTVTWTRKTSGEDDVVQRFDNVQDMSLSVFNSRGDPLSTSYSGAKMIQLKISFSTGNSTVFKVSPSYVLRNKNG